MFASLAIIAMLASSVPTTVLGAASYSDELQGAYDYAYGMGVTTQSSIENADMYGQLKRSHMAKMMVNFAKEVKSLTADTSKECNFTDVANQTEELQGYIKEACQMGLMGVGITAFNPNGIVTRAQFGTVLSRVLYGDAYNVDTNPYYAEHLKALKDAGIMTNISNPNAPEVRGYVMLMMQRSDEGTTPAVCSTPENVLSCSLGLDTCPTECKTTEVNTNGNLDVSLRSSVGGDVPYGVSSLAVATYKFTASEDIRLDNVVIKRAGYFTATNVPSAALFLNGGRISKVANFSSSSDEATLTITNGYQMKAGETVEFAVHVMLGIVSNTDQFNITVKGIGSTAKDVNLADNLTSATYKVVTTAAATLTADDGSTSDAPKLWAKAADLWEFTLNNPSSNDQDIVLNAITFKENGGSIDESTDLENFKLVVDGTTIATTPKLVGKYLPFTIANGYKILEGRTPTFTVKADIIGGAGKTVMFTLENAMDIVAIGLKHNQGAKINLAWNAMDTVTVSAGRVTVNRINPPSTDLVGNKKDQFLGALEIVNNAGEALKLSTLGLAITGDVTKLDSIKVRLGSASASAIDLTANGAKTLWTETSLEKSIGSKLTVYVYADTIDTGMDNTTFRMSLNTTTTSSFLVQESTDENNVTDLSPSSLTWSLMNGKDASMTLTDVALGNKTVAEGTNGVETLKFKLKAGAAYGVKIKKLTFTTPFNSNTIAGATLYNGTTAYSATVNSGNIVVDEDFLIASAATAELTLKLDVQLNPTVTGFAVTLNSGGVEAEDTTEYRNTVSVSNSITGRTITVSDAGEIVAAYEATADNNKYNKNVLAGTTETVAEYSLYSKYEAVNVWKAVVTLSRADIDNSLLDLQLVYNGVVVASNPTWNSTGTIATFEDLNFDTLLATTPLLVKVVTKTINEDGWSTLNTWVVSSIVLSEMKGKDSGDDVTVGGTLATSTKTFTIVPVTILPAVASIGTASADLTINAAIGSNQTSGGVTAKATLSNITFAIDGNNGGLTKVTVKDDAGTVLGSGNANGDASISIALTKEVTAGATTLTVSSTLSGSINTPSYNVSVSSIGYTTNVDSTAISAQFGSAKKILVK